MRKTWETRSFLEKSSLGVVKRKKASFSTYLNKPYTGYHLFPWRWFYLPRLHLLAPQIFLLLGQCLNPTSTVSHHPHYRPLPTSSISILTGSSTPPLPNIPLTTTSSSTTFNKPNFTLFTQCHHSQTGWHPQRSTAGEEDDLITGLRYRSITFKELHHIYYSYIGLNASWHDHPPLRQSPNVMRPWWLVLCLSCDQAPAVTPTSEKQIKQYSSDWNVLIEMLEA